MRGYEIEVVTDPAQLDVLAWDHLNTGLPFSGTRWLPLYRQMLQDPELILLLLRRQGRLVGRAILTQSRQPGVPITSALGRRIVKLVLGRFPILVCQTPLACASGLLLPEGDEVNALRALDVSVRQLARGRHASFFTLGWLNPAQRQIVAQTGLYQHMEMDGATWLPVKWASFEEYVSSLGKSARKDLHRHMNRARDLGIVVERTHRFAHLRDSLLPLIGNVEAAHNSADARVFGPNILEVTERELPDRSVMLLARCGESLAGCGLLLHDEGTLILAMLGLDYQFKYVYFQLLYEAIRYAIENGIRAVRGGSGAYEFKQRLCFQLEPTCVAYTAYGTAFRWLATRMAGAIGSSNSADITIAATEPA